MAKKKKTPIGKIKLKCKGGQATPAPPVGPALGQHGLNPGQFVKTFNDLTRDQMGIPLCLVLHVYDDKTFDIEIKGAPASFLIKQAAGIAKGSGVPNREKVGKITMEQIREIAEQKKKYMNSHSIEQAMKIIAGTAKSMGVDVIEA